jgi:hypothetical protein
MRTTANRLASASRSRPARPRGRRGIVLVAVLVLFSVSLTLFGLWSRAVVRESSGLSTLQFRLQAAQLAQAGVERAIALHAADAKFTDEVWSVAAADLDKTHAAQVRIRVAPASNAGGFRYEATAEFPVGALHRAQLTKSVEIPNPTPMKKS